MLYWIIGLGVGIFLAYIGYKAITEETSGPSWEEMLLPPVLFLIGLVAWLPIGVILFLMMIWEAQETFSFRDFLKKWRK